MAQLKTLSILKYQGLEYKPFSTADCLARFIAQLGRCCKEIDIEQLEYNLSCSVSGRSIVYEALYHAMLYFAEWGLKPQFVKKMLWHNSLSGNRIVLIKNNDSLWDVFVGNEQVGFSGEYDVALCKYYSKVYSEEKKSFNSEDLLQPLQPPVFRDGLAYQVAQLCVSRPSTCIKNWGNMFISLCQLENQPIFSGWYPTV